MASFEADAPTREQISAIRERGMLLMDRSELSRSLSRLPWRRPRSPVKFWADFRQNQLIEQFSHPRCRHKLHIEEWARFKTKLHDMGKSSRYLLKPGWRGGWKGYQSVALRYHLVPCTELRIQEAGECGAWQFLRENCMGHYGKDDLNLLKKEKLWSFPILAQWCRQAYSTGERRIGGIRIPRDVFMQLTSISIFWPL